MDESVVDDGAADFLVELEERLHLVHREASGLFGETGEVVEIEGGASRPDAAAAEVVVVAAALLGRDREEERRSRGVSAEARGRGRGADVGDAVGEGEEDGPGDGEEGEENGADPLPHRQRAPRRLQITREIDE